MLQEELMWSYIHNDARMPNAGALIVAFTPSETTQAVGERKCFARFIADHNLEGILI